MSFWRKRSSSAEHSVANVAGYGANRSRRASAPKHGGSVPTNRTRACLISSLAHAEFKFTHGVIPEFSRVGRGRIAGTHSVIWKVPGWVPDTLSGFAAQRSGMTRTFRPGLNSSCSDPRGATVPACRSCASGGSRGARRKGPRRSRYRRARASPASRRPAWPVPCPAPAFPCGRRSSRRDCSS